MHYQAGSILTTSQIRNFTKKNLLEAFQEVSNAIISD